ncbi:MAG: hypothetical protein WC326_13895 [Candidatus Delongbacteria bacterium]
MEWIDLKKDHCPICDGVAAVEPPENSNKKDILCERCGSFSITIGAQESMLDFSDAAKRKYERARWSYFINHLNREHVEVTSSFVMENKAKAALPTPDEQLDAFILLFYESALYISQMIRISNAVIYKTCGLIDQSSIEYVASYYKDMGLISGVGLGSNAVALRLTPSGWSHCKSLLSNEGDNKLIFMAMEYRIFDIESAYVEVFKQAVKGVGFNLFKNDEMPTPGIIDHHLRNNIRRSRMLFADLTTENNGAYWEAGFAEGLGKPVLYFCRKDVWDTIKSHFDTNHCTTVIWSRENDDECKKQIQDILRNTFPNEAL